MIFFILIICAFDNVLMLKVAKFDSNLTLIILDKILGLQTADWK